MRLELCAWTGETICDDLRVVEYRIEAGTDGTPQAVDSLWDTILAAAADLDAATGGRFGEPECLAYYECGGERVDDVLFGGISDAPDGVYAEYVNTIGAFLSSAGAVAAPAPVFTIDRDTLASNLADNALGDQPRGDYMPVFYYCRIGTDGPIEFAVEDFAPSFEWATTITEQYDVPGARLGSLETLRTVLAGSPPQMQTIPPIERGYTFVRLPMWLWLENIDDLDGFAVHAISEEGTVRLATRATLVDVTWIIGDTTLTCTPSEMREFVHGADSITDPPPPCVHRFDELTEYTITATARYTIEGQLAYRGGTTFAWPDAPWTAHPTDPIVTISNETGAMEVHEVVSVNVPIDVGPGADG